MTILVICKGHQDDNLSGGSETMIISGSGKDWAMKLKLSVETDDNHSGGE